VAEFLDVGPRHWMLLSLLLFSIGIYGMLTRRNAIGILLSVELLLNAAALNFVIFNHYRNPAAVDGAVMAIFIIAVAAARLPNWVATTKSRHAWPAIRTSGSSASGGHVVSSPSSHRGTSPP
jgi:NADH-quinone oxidoreductase subunit K